MNAKEARELTNKIKEQYKDFEDEFCESFLKILLVDIEEEINKGWSSYRFNIKDFIDKNEEAISNTVNSDWGSQYIFSKCRGRFSQFLSDCLEKEIKDLGYQVTKTDYDSYEEFTIRW